MCVSAGVKSQQQEMQLVLFSHLQIHYDMFPGSITPHKVFQAFFRRCFSSLEGLNR